MSSDSGDVDADSVGLGRATDSEGERKGKRETEGDMDGCDCSDLYEIGVSVGVVIVTEGIVIDEAGGKLSMIKRSGFKWYLRQPIEFLA